ncbi:MAG: PIN domain-containing protein [Micromonosporaceae bacterium]|nr:PIN domain-containing protein [Micromonosporaceae bacterium]
MVFALASDDPAGEAARGVLAADPLWLAPTHMPIEVMRTFWRKVIGRQLDAADAEIYVSALLDTEVTYHGVDAGLLAAIWRLRHHISAYDAAYVALAEAYGAALVTFDQRLAKAASPLGVSVVVPA